MGCYKTCSFSNCSLAHSIPTVSALKTMFQLFNCRYESEGCSMCCYKAQLYQSSISALLKPSPVARASSISSLHLSFY